MTEVILETMNLEWLLGEPGSEKVYDLMVFILRYYEDVYY